MPAIRRKLAVVIDADISKFFDNMPHERIREILRLRINDGTFDFLGFTHYWGRSRSGNWGIKRQTMRKRKARAMRNLFIYCRNNRHDPVSEQYRKLCSKLHGLYNLLWRYR